MDTLKGWLTFLENHPGVIPVLSLSVALLAVFVGPLLSWLAVRRQVNANIAIANKQVIGGMRQVWINNLRELLAEFGSSAEHYWQAGFEDRTDGEYKHMTLLRHRIALMLNLSEHDHITLDECIGKILRMLETDKASITDFAEQMGTFSELSRKILKTEWNRIKDPLAPI